MDEYTGPCQLCMDGRERVQLALYNGRWTPWPLVSVRPDDAPMILADVCPQCETDRFNSEEVPRLNGKLRAAGCLRETA